MNNTIGIIFIHGAGLGSWIWDDVVKNISLPYACADYTALERSTSKATLAEYVTSVSRQVEALNVQRVIVVAHSVGGVVGSELSGILGEKLAAYIGISAAIPKPGGNFVSTLPFPQKLIMPIILKLAGTKPPESAIRSGLGDGLTASQTDAIVAKFQQESVHLYTDKTSSGPMPNVSALYIRTTNDKEFPLATQDASAARLVGAKVYDIDSGHMPMLSHPDLVADQINQLATSI